MGCCACYKTPPHGTFIVGKVYTWGYIIDGVYVEDEKGDRVPFGEIEWMYFFIKQTGE